MTEESNQKGEGNKEGKPQKGMIQGKRKSREK
jgi:hypothetical protein